MILANCHFKFQFSVAQIKYNTQKQAHIHTYTCMKTHTHVLGWYSHRLTRFGMEEWLQGYFHKWYIHP